MRAFSIDAPMKIFFHTNGAALRVGSSWRRFFRKQAGNMAPEKPSRSCRGILVGGEGIVRPKME